MEPARDSEGDATPDGLVESVRALVERYCRARLGGYPGGDEVAADVTHEVCRTAVTVLQDREDRGAPLAAVVFSIASHKVAEARRRLERSATGGESSSGG